MAAFFCLRLLQWLVLCHGSFKKQRVLEGLTHDSSSTAAPVVVKLIMSTEQSLSQCPSHTTPIFVRSA